MARNSMFDNPRFADESNQPGINPAVPDINPVIDTSKAATIDAVRGIGELALDFKDQYDLYEFRNTLEESDAAVQDSSLRDAVLTAVRNEDDAAIQHFTSQLSKLSLAEKQGVFRGSGDMKSVRTRMMLRDKPWLSSEIRSIAASYGVSGFGGGSGSSTADLDANDPVIQVENKVLELAHTGSQYFGLDGNQLHNFIKQGLAGAKPNEILNAMDSADVNLGIANDLLGFSPVPEDEFGGGPAGPTTENSRSLYQMQIATLDAVRRQQEAGGVVDWRQINAGYEAFFENKRAAYLSEIQKAKAKGQIPEYTEEMLDAQLNTHKKRIFSVLNAATKGRGYVGADATTYGELIKLDAQINNYETVRKYTGMLGVNEELLNLLGYFNPNNDANTQGQILGNILEVKRIIASKSPEDIRTMRAKNNPMQNIIYEFLTKGGDTETGKVIGAALIDEVINSDSVQFKRDFTPLLVQSFNRPYDKSDAKTQALVDSAFAHPNSTLMYEVFMNVQGGTDEFEVDPVYKEKYQNLSRTDVDGFKTEALAEFAPPAGSTITMEGFSSSKSGPPQDHYIQFDKGKGIFKVYTVNEAGEKGSEISPKSELGKRLKQVNADFAVRTHHGWWLDTGGKQAYIDSLLSINDKEFVPTGQGIEFKESPAPGTGPYAGGRRGVGAPSSARARGMQAARRAAESAAVEPPMQDIPADLTTAPADTGESLMGIESLDMPSIIDHTIVKSEGGYQANPKDKGNWTGGAVGQGVNAGTNMGITPVTLAVHRGVSPGEITAEDIKSLSKDEAVEIYEKMYYKGPGLDQLPPNLGGLVFDMGVVMGPRKAIQILQQAAGITADGRIGPSTVQAVSQIDYAKLEKAYEKYFRSIAKGDKAGFLDGWLKRLRRTVSTYGVGDGPTA